MEAIEFAKIINEAGYEFRSYSGRGMYGTQCIGVVTDKGIFQTLADFIELCEDTADAAEMVEWTISDSMGRDIILYWPNYEWSEELSLFLNDVMDDE